MSELQARLITRKCFCRGAREGRVFFSEEKKQKTFMFWQLHIGRPWPEYFNRRRNKSLLVLFFRKEQSSLLFAFKPAFATGFRKGAHAGDVAGAFGYADHAARIEKVEQMACLDALIVGG
jgi:hypothetical protein